LSIAQVLTASIALSVGELYDQISPAQGSVGRTFSQGLLLVLSAIGALCLIIEAMALIAGFALAKSLTGSVHALFTGTERVRQGDFTHKIEVRSEDQLGELADRRRVVEVRRVHQRRRLRADRLGERRLRRRGLSRHVDRRA
jgi:nitrogen fixation/metabolism regulation signal transduction histidine kinase